MNKTKKETPPITLDEVIEAVRKVKKGKARGVDNIPEELLANAGDVSCRILWKICTEYGTKENGQKRGMNH